MAFKLAPQHIEAHPRRLRFLRLEGFDGFAFCSVLGRVLYEFGLAAGLPVDLWVIDLSIELVLPSDD